MTRLLQLTAYATKGLTRTRVGSSVVSAARSAAGLYFDVVQREYKTEGMVFAVPKESTTRKMRGKFVADTYELPERTLAKRHLRGESRVLELGGCIGVVSCVVNRLLDSPTSHVVVEANPSLIPTLTHNRDVNRAAFSIENGVVSRKASERLAIQRNMDSSYLDAQGIPVAAKTLETLEAAYGMQFDALVMDIEGGEAAFIESHVATLRHLTFAMIEFHPEALGETTVARLRGMLQDAGLCQIDQMLTTEVYVRRKGACGA